MSLSLKDNGWAMLSNGVEYISQGNATLVKNYWRDVMLPRTSTSELRAMLGLLCDRQTPTEADALATIDNNMRGLTVYLAWITPAWILKADRDSLIEKLEYQPAQAMQTLDVWFDAIRECAELGLLGKPRKKSAAFGVSKSVYA